jgi:hypothetical protein
MGMRGGDGIPGRNGIGEQQRRVAMAPIGLKQTVQPCPCCCSVRGALQKRIIDPYGQRHMLPADTGPHFAVPLGVEFGKADVGKALPGKVENFGNGGLRHHRAARGNNRAVQRGIVLRLVPTIAEAAIGACDHDGP